MKWFRWFFRTAHLERKIQEMSVQTDALVAQVNALNTSITAAVNLLNANAASAVELQTTNAAIDGVTAQLTTINNQLAAVIAATPATTPTT